MADPRPLTRDELAEFLPNQRAIRAFEKLFDLIPPELEDILIVAETALSAAYAVRTENVRLRQQLEALQLQVESIKQFPNLDNLVKRVDILETLEG